MIAALFVETGGVYYGLPDVDPWDEERDARLYDGPWPVVAHPPCARWCRLAGFVEARCGYRVGDDGGTFEAALAAVRRFGGVLEHPAHSLAWKRYALPRPARGGWSSALWDDGLATEVDQHSYGHPAHKSTWLYYVGESPPALDWRHSSERLPQVTGVGRDRKPWLYDERWRVRPRQAASTPPAFRDALLSLAASL